MGIFNKRDIQQEMMASQALKILYECVDIFNNTKNPDIFFERYKLAWEQTEILCKCNKVKFKGHQPKQIQKQLIDKRQSAIHDMIERFFDETTLKASKVKKIDSKKKKFINFLAVLDDYFVLMNEDNIQYANTLYENAINYFSKE